MARILIVDDDEHNREILRLRLVKAGYEIQEALDGEAGVEAAQTNPPDMIILDVMMPKMDGWQVCRALKTDFRTKKVPVILLTARNQQIEELRGWESGADDYLTKPFDSTILMEKIGALLPSKENPS